MAAGIPARLTAAQGRRFGLTVGGAFLVLAAIAWWRGHPTTTEVLGGLGGVLALAGLIVPTLLGPVERGWMALAHLISKVTTPIVMGVMYLLVLTPVGFLRRLFGGNPMVHMAHDASYWKPRPENKRAGNLTRQY
ncbi:MAG TPA: SxtJ family membrane protein [Vicinamibacterales bacterium]|nr:SxtJ family membrane protein [Vicinamibacterales bacterium]HQZ37435.1 SxtJ family membrane protein [Vicinamibacterales bacterium]